MAKLSKNTAPASQDRVTEPVEVRVSERAPVSRRIRGAGGSSRRVALFFPAGSGRAKQNFKDECDINTIMARYQRTGSIEHVRKVEPRYLDVSGLDYLGAMQLVAESRTMFQELPALLRARFKNDPAELLAFLEDPKNRDEGVELGLVVAPEAPAKAPPATPPAAPPKEAPTEPVKGSQDQLPT